MLKFFFFLILATSFSPLQADDLIVCQNSQNCRCPDQTTSPVPAQFTLDEAIPTGPVMSCRSVAATVVTTLEAPPAPQVDCPPEGENTLFDRMVSTFPSGCGYVLRRFNGPAFQETIQEYLKTGRVLCDRERHHSMCTSAVFLAFLNEMKRRRDAGLITEEQLLAYAQTRGPAYDLINYQARPDLLMQELQLGEGKTLRSGEIPSNDWPKEGDIVQMWRKDRSGHTTIFSGYLKDGEGKAIGLCFWSSNLATDGYGKYCEAMSDVDHLVIGRFN